MLRKSMSVLRLFTPTRQELGVTEAADLLGCSKSSVSRWMRDMEAEGFLDRDEATGRYRLGIRLVVLGELAKQATSLQRLAQPALERLTLETGETSNLVVMVGDEAVNVLAVESPRPIKHVGWPGRRIPLHATASGKSLLAWRKPEEVRALLPAPLPRFTPATITDAEALLAELARVRAQGYSEAWAELEEDLVGIAAPVWDHSGTVVGVLTIGAPNSRVSREMLPTLAGHVLGAARSVSAGLGYDGA